MVGLRNRINLKPAIRIPFRGLAISFSFTSVHENNASITSYLTVYHAKYLKTGVLLIMGSMERGLLLATRYPRKLGS